MRLLLILLSLAACTRAPAAAAPPPAAPQSCGSAALLTYEHGELAAVGWVEHTPGHVHTREISNHTQIVDATIDVRADETVAHSSVAVSIAGSAEPPMTTAMDFDKTAIYWSPRLPSSIEQAIRRARVLGAASTVLPGASLYGHASSDITVERVDPTDWAVGYQDKRYLVLTDERGCMISATMPDYGVTIERRATFSPDAYRPWTPYGAPPDGAYTAQDVAIPAPQGHVLAGTLTLPPRAGTVPAVVLITGLSPSERNGGDAPWMVHRDLSDAFTRAGFAVLRCDDRGVGKSTGDQKTFTSQAKVEDVHTEVAWLRAHPGIDPKRVMLVGYSEGGLIGPMAAAGDPSIAAVITLDGPGVTGHEVAQYQVEQPILRDSTIAAADRPAAIANAMTEALKGLSAHEQSFLAIDSLAFDRQVRCPALIVQGGADATVPLRSAERIAAAMRAGGNRDVTVRIFPGVSHSLLPDPGGLPSGWAALPAFLVTPELLDAVTRWSVAKLGVR